MSLATDCQLADRVRGEQQLVVAIMWQTETNVKTGETKEKHSQLVCTVGIAILFVQNNIKSEAKFV